MKDGAIRLDSEIELENPKIKDAAVIDKGDDADNGRDEQQDIQAEVHHRRSAPRQRSGARHRQRRMMPAAPPKTRHQSEPQQESEKRVDVDPKPLRLLRPGIVQQTQDSDTN